MTYFDAGFEDEPPRRRWLDWRGKIIPALVIAALTNPVTWLMSNGGVIVRELVCVDHKDIATGEHPRVPSPNQPGVLPTGQGPQF